MAQNSKIEWTDATFNPWMGCTKVSEACAYCYAEVSTPVRRQRAAGNELWGKGAKRVRTSEAYWKQPIRWNEQSVADCLECDYHHGFLKRDRGCMEVGCSCGGGLSFRRPRVFGGSLCDWLDDEVPIEWLADYLKLIHATPHLDWLLLTKRPENFQLRMQDVLGSTVFDFASERDLDFRDWLMVWLGEGDGPYGLKRAGVPQNVWIGTTVENQARADERVPKLLGIPAAVRFLSVEPMLEKIDLRYACFNGADSFGAMPGIDWVICGGESGSKCRPFDPDWARDLHFRCSEAGVPFFMKQMSGKRKPLPEIPEDLMVREFPTNEER